MEMPGAALLDLFGANPFFYGVVARKIISVERAKTFTNFSIICEIVRKGESEKTDMPRRGRNLGHKAMDVREKSVSLPLVIRRKKVAKAEDSTSFFLAFF